MRIYKYNETLVNPFTGGDSVYGVGAECRIRLTCGNCTVNAQQFVRLRTNDFAPNF